MIEFHLTAESISKYFIRGIYIFKDIDLSLKNSEIIAIAGENGSGKTTFLKILAGILNPSSGTVNLKIDGKEITRENFTDYIGFVSPYLILYEEFTPIEHFMLFAKMRKIKYNEEYINGLLKQFKIFNRRNDIIKTFSSGMKQRIKYILALQNNPLLLFLDEPYTNLDTGGIDSVTGILQDRAESGCGIIIASNDEREKNLCSGIVQLKN